VTTDPHPLTKALCDALERLQADDAEGAGVIVEGVMRALESAPPLGAAQTARARELLACCVAEERRLRQQSSGTLAAMGLSRRAGVAYGR
jgi:hypothetical protein